MSPKRRLLPETRLRAWLLEKYPSFSAAFHTRLASCGLTVGTRLSVRDTVAVETRAFAAMSRMSMEGFRFPVARSPARCTQRRRAEITADVYFTESGSVDSGKSISGVVPSQLVFEVRNCRVTIDQ